MNPRAVPGCTFRRAQRLADAADFARVLRDRPIAASAHFQVFRAPAQRGARLGVIVGKRFVARAVDRNSVKRVVREVFRSRRTQLPPTDYVVRVKTRIRLVDTTMLRAEIENLLGVES